jgi:hypothetical protein
MVGARKLLSKQEMLHYLHDCYGVNEYDDYSFADLRHLLLTTKSDDNRTMYQEALDYNGR